MKMNKNYMKNMKPYSGEYIENKIRNCILLVINSSFIPDFCISNEYFVCIF